MAGARTHKARRGRRPNSTAREKTQTNCQTVFVQTLGRRASSIRLEMVQLASVMAGGRSKALEAVWLTLQQELRHTCIHGGVPGGDTAAGTSGTRMWYC